MYNPHDTIAATATPPGKGALAIVRMSGRESWEIAGEIFFRKERKFKNFKSHRLYYGNIKDNSKKIDTVLISTMKSPKSYTGEDTVEITCHGGNYVTSRILESLLKNGARPANPGEFTMRAFINGKMDLARAEAVNSIIDANSERSLEEALKMHDGRISDKIKIYAEEASQIKTEVDASIEWGETEEIDPAGISEIQKRLKKLTEKIKKEADEAPSDERLGQGFRVVICGKPNAGKSSVFNSLLKSSKNIISSHPGTTRDVVEGELILNGFLVKLIDTAGIGVEVPDEIYKMASEKSKREIKNADVVLYIIDAEKGIQEEDYKIKKLCNEDRFIPVVNKSDIRKRVKGGSEFYSGIEEVNTSCMTKEGFEKLKKRIGEKLSEYDTDRAMITARQRNSLFRAEKELREAEKNIKDGEFVVASYEITSALSALGNIDGSTVNERTLDRIFERFCIGK